VAHIEEVIALLHHIVDVLTVNNLGNGHFGVPLYLSSSSRNFNKRLMWL
jgi:hypothetical protein